MGGPDPYAELLARREIHLLGEITAESANIVIAQLLFLQQEAPGEPVLVCIDSPGGSVTATLAIIDTIAFLTPPVWSHGLGRAREAAALVLASGARGHRTARPDCQLSLSPPRACLPVEQDVYESIWNEMVAVVMRTTGCGRSEAEALYGAGARFGVAAARDFGLIDGVRQEPPRAV